MLAYADSRWGRRGELYRLMKFMFPVIAAYLATILRDLFLDPSRDMPVTMLIAAMVILLLYLIFCYINLLLESPRVAQRISVDGEMVTVHYYSGTMSVFSLQDVTGVGEHEIPKLWVSFLKGNAASVQVKDKRDVVVSAHLQGAGDVLDILTSRLDTKSGM